MNPRRGCGWGRRIRAHVDACWRVAGRRADDDARILRDDAAVLPDDVPVAHLRGVHHALLKVEVQRAEHGQLVLDHLLDVTVETILHRLDVDVEIIEKSGMIERTH